MIYLDYAANTPVLPQVMEVFSSVACEYIGNPNSNHQAGKNAKAKMDEITESLARYLGVKANEIIYTSGASEANNLALKGLVRSYRHTGKHIISTFLEHPSVSGTMTALQEQGYEIELLSLNEDGVVDLEHLKELLRNDTVIVSVCMMDSELGTIQPIKEIQEICSAYPNCHLHVDATQAFGKCQVDFTNIDCVTFSPHKFYGLNGCGVLVKREEVILEPLIHGGTSTTIYRSGTPALALAASTLKAVELALEDLLERQEIIRNHNQVLVEFFKGKKEVRINSPKNASPYFINISVKDVKGRDFQRRLDEHGVCVSVKSACSVVNTPSRAVFAVSKDRKNAMSSFRISLSHLTTKEEIIEFQRIFELCLKEQKNG